MSCLDGFNSTFAPNNLNFNHQNFYHFVKGLGDINVMKNGLMILNEYFE